MKKIIALLLLVCSTLTMVAVEGCLFRIKCLVVGTSLPDAYIDCVNDYDHDANGDWLQGDTDVWLSYCHGDTVYTSLQQCVAGNQAIVEVQCNPSGYGWGNTSYGYMLDGCKQEGLTLYAYCLGGSPPQCSDSALVNHAYDDCPCNGSRMLTSDKKFYRLFAWLQPDWLSRLN